MKYAFNLDQKCERDPATRIKSGKGFHNLEPKYWTVW